MLVTGILLVAITAFALQRDGKAQPTIADCNVYVALPADRKGTHMSRLVALLEARSDPGEPLIGPFLAPEEPGADPSPHEVSTR